MSTKHSIQSDGPPCTYVTEAKTRANHFSVESGLSLCHEEVQDDEGEGGEAEVDGAEACGAAEVCHGVGGGSAVNAGVRVGERVEGADGEEVQAGQRRYLVVPLKGKRKVTYTQFPLIRDSVDFRLVCPKKFPEF